MCVLEAETGRAINSAGESCLAFGAVEECAVKDGWWMPRKGDGEGPVLALLRMYTLKQMKRIKGKAIALVSAGWRK